MSVLRTESADNCKDLRQVRDYILRLNRSVQNVFNSLDPDDNFSEAELQRYNEHEKKIASMELGINGFRTLYADIEHNIASEISQTQESISLKVRKDDIINQINLETEAINIKGDRIDIATDNFVLHGDKAVVAGTITANTGRIAGWEIKGSQWKGDKNSRIDVDTLNADYGEASTINATGEVTIKATLKGNFEEIDCEGAEFRGGFSCSTMEAKDKGSYDLDCLALRCYKTYRRPQEWYPDTPTMPTDGTHQFPERYNTNEYPIGGLVCAGCQVPNIYSKLAKVTWSDRRLKKNIKSVSTEEGYELLESLKPSEFKFKKEGIRSTGFIAQETPEFFRTKRSGYYGLKYTSINCTLDATLKDMTKRLNEALHE